MYTCTHHSFRAAPRFLSPRVNNSNAKRRNSGRRISTTAKFGEPRNFDEDGVGGGDGDRDFYNNNNRRQQHQNNSSWREDGRGTMRGGDRGAREFDGRRNGDREISGEMTSTEDAEARDSEEEDEEEDAEEEESAAGEEVVTGKDNEEIEMKILAAITEATRGKEI